MILEAFRFDASRSLPIEPAASTEGLRVPAVIFEASRSAASSVLPMEPGASIEGLRVPAVIFEASSAAASSERTFTLLPDLPDMLCC